LRRDAPSLLAQLVLTALGVYLGLRADQWREDRARAELGQTTLRNFQRELTANRADVASRLPYHSRVAAGLQTVMRRGGPLTMPQLIEQTGFDGTKPVEFRTTAWDLAIATEALAFLDQRLAFDLAAIYKHQQSIARFADQYLEALFITNIFAARDVYPGVIGMEDFFRETARDEGRLMAHYDSILPRIGRALGR